MYKFLIAFLFYSLTSFESNAQESEERSAAVSFFNLTRFIEWPVTLSDTMGRPFVISIYGENPFSYYLDDAVRNKYLYGRPVIVRYNVDKNELLKSQIIFYNRKTDKKLLKLLQQTGTLKVSNNHEFCEDGGAIRFIKKNNVITLQINNDVAKKANLKISPKLLSLAQIVKSC